MKIVVFSPYSYIKEWRLMDLYLANVLNDKKNEIIFLECNGYQKTCVAMLSAGLSWDSPKNKKNEICSDCKNFTRITSNVKNTVHLKLDSFLAHGDDIISSFLQKNKINQNFKFQDIKIGEAALYSLLIENQYTDFSEIRKNKLDDYVQELQTGIKTVLAGTKFFQLYKPEILLLHNGLYATGNILAQLAKTHNCDVYCHINGSDRQSFNSSIRIGKGNYYQQISHLKKKFRKPIKVSFDEKTTLAGHLSFLFFGKSDFRYSTDYKGKLPAWFERKIQGKKIALLPLSSYDELVGAHILGYKTTNSHKHIFKNQLDWVLYTIDILKKVKNLFLIIRPHPREFPNPRTRTEKPTNHVLNLLSKISTKINENVFINLPQDNISIYDIFSKTSLVINGWSTAGEEAALLGKSVITSFPFFANYPKALTFFPKTKANYKKYILRSFHNECAKKSLKSRFEAWRAFSISRCEEPTPNFQEILKKFHKPDNWCIKLFVKTAPKTAFKHLIVSCLKKNSQSKIPKLLEQNKNFLFEIESQ